MEKSKVSEKSAACVQCGEAIEQQRRGRPKAYCGPGCRGAAAYELKRLQRRLEALEIRCADLRTQREREHYRDYVGRTTTEQLAAVEAQIEEAETRLRVLLASAPTMLSPETRGDTHGR